MMKRISHSRRYEPMGQKITREIMKATVEWLGPDGIAHFKRYKEKYGTVSPTFMDGRLPWPVHFREGMKVRNFLRTLPDCKGWNDHDLDAAWAEVIESALAIDVVEKATGPNHKEAFCQMIYRCGKCHFLEVLYNSRDGVTPFMIGCRNCGDAAQHVHWELDNPIRNYEPPVGSRIFIDMTKEKAEKLARERMEQFKDNRDFPSPPEGTVEYQEQIDSLIENFYHGGEAPDINEVT
jgi:hypothetical protein